MLRNLAALAWSLGLIGYCKYSYSYYSSVTPKPACTRKNNLQEYAYKRKIQGKCCSVISSVLVLVARSDVRVIILEIVKYMKVIIPGQDQKVLRSTFWHMLAGKNCRCVSVWGLSPQAPPVNSAYYITVVFYCYWWMGFIREVLMLTILGYDAANAKKSGFRTLIIICLCCFSFLIIITVINPLIRCLTFLRCFCFLFISRQKSSVNLVRR